MILLAGPNGAGKSTLYKTVIQPRAAIPFINADEIQLEEMADPTEAAAYRAAGIAEERRRWFIDMGYSFATETVFSHQSKLELVTQAQQEGFVVHVYHVGLDGPDLAEARVAERMREGGHSVPKRKIKARFDRSAPLIRKAVMMADLGIVFDNSLLNEPPRKFIQFEAAEITSLAPDTMPAWISKLYALEIERFHAEMAQSD